MSVELIELQPTPNQEFSITVNNIDMTVNLKYSGETEKNEGIMLFALRINDEYVCPFVPCFSNQGVLPYPYMVSEAGGNFYFVTDNEQYPVYNNFGSSCFLYFITKDEING